MYSKGRKIGQGDAEFGKKVPGGYLCVGEIKRRERILIRPYMRDPVICKRELSKTTVSTKSGGRDFGAEKLLRTSIDVISFDSRINVSRIEGKRSILSGSRR